MKKIMSFQRPRIDAGRPFRLWMTSSLAVVMAAMIPLRDVSEAERSHMLRVLRHSRFGVDETVQRIGAAARDRGLAVLAWMPGARPVLVLASSVGGTPVVMLDADSHPAVPLSVMVRPRQDGRAEVLLASTAMAHSARDWAELPGAVTDDLRALPGLIDRALA